MQTKRVVIIGGGPGGYVAAIRCAQLGAKVTLVEKDKIGGTCLNRGCIPTKALLSDAKLLRSLKSSPVFQSLIHEGFNFLESMMDRKKNVVREMVKGVEMLLESQRITVKYGHADLQGSNQVTILSGEGERKFIETDAIILAPGSKSKVPPNINTDGEKIINSDQALEINRIPGETVIVGGGYIGVELAFLFNTLGSKVTIVEILKDILPGLEQELVRNLLRVFEKDGIRILTRSSVKDVQYYDEGFKLTLETPQGLQEMTTEKLLLSVGRTPNLSLNFSAAGIKTSTEGIPVNMKMETNTPHIYAIGDATGGVMLAHVAMEQGLVAAENVMGIDREMKKNLIPFCVFTYPEIASIGLTEKDARVKGEVKIGRFPFRSNPTALISGETEGFIKVIANRETDEILGVHIIGHQASTLISIASCYINQGMKLREFSKLIQAHPSAPEALREAILDVDGMAIHLPKLLQAEAKR